MSPVGRPHARQKVLFLWLADSALDAQVIAWAMYDGASPKGTAVPPVDTSAAPPYRSGLEAIRDGWRLFQVSPLTAPAPGAETHTSYLRHEFVFERFADQPSGV